MDRLYQVECSQFVRSQVLAVTVLVLAANTVAYAATGGRFILGHTNKTSKASTLKRTKNGPALKLVTKSSSNAPLSKGAADLCRLARGRPDTHAGAEGLVDKTQPQDCLPSGEVGLLVLVDQNCCVVCRLAGAIRRLQIATVSTLVAPTWIDVERPFRPAG